VLKSRVIFVFSLEVVVKIKTHKLEFQLFKKAGHKVLKSLNVRFSGCLGKTNLASGEFDRMRSEFL